MSYIEIDTVLNLIADIMQDCKVTHKHRALNRNIKQIPTADVVEVRHGTWYHGVENGAVYAKCSACSKKMNYSCYGYAYCSLCGARMDGERKDEK